MSAQIIELPDPNATLLEIARAAHVRGLHLIHDGRKIVVSPIIPPGWREVIIKQRAAA